MKRQTSLKRKDSGGGTDAGGAEHVATEAHQGKNHDEHILLDVWSIKQGSLRLQTVPFSVVLVAVMGLYFCIGAILNWNEIDADQVCGRLLCADNCGRPCELVARITNEQIFACGMPSDKHSLTCPRSET